MGSFVKLMNTGQIFLKTCMMDIYLVKNHITMNWLKCKKPTWNEEKKLLKKEMPISSEQKKDEPKRKSKWDQVGPSNVPVVRATAPTTSASKTSIPAFGALKK